MSETVLKILFSELNIVRVKCLNPRCRVIIECTLGELCKFCRGFACPVCREKFNDVLGPDPTGDCFDKLYEAMYCLHRNKDRVEVEFVLPVPKPPAP